MSESMSIFSKKTQIELKNSEGGIKRPRGCLPGNKRLVISLPGWASNSQHVAYFFEHLFRVLVLVLCNYLYTNNFINLTMERIMSNIKENI